MNRHQIFAVVVWLLALVASANVVHAQSKDRANPTKLTSNEISGIVDSESRGNFYYYSFTANPGEVTITLTVDPGRKANDNDFMALTVVGFSVYDRNAEEIAGKGVTTANEQGSKQAVARIEVTRRQTFVLGVSMPEGAPYRSVGGKYRIRISGTVELGKEETTTRVPSEDPITASQNMIRQMEDGTFDYLNMLPKKGTMIIKMKDGSKKIIDLSEAETITVVP